MIFYVCRGILCVLQKTGKRHWLYIRMREQSLYCLILCFLGLMVLQYAAKYVKMAIHLL